MVNCTKVQKDDHPKVQTQTAMHITKKKKEEEERKAKKIKQSHLYLFKLSACKWKNIKNSRESAQLAV